MCIECLYLNVCIEMYIYQKNNVYFYGKNEIVVKYKRDQLIIIRASSLDSCCENV